MSRPSEAPSPTGGNSHGDQGRCQREVWSGGVSVVVPDNPAGLGATDAQWNRVVEVFVDHAGEFLSVRNHVELSNLEFRLGLGEHPFPVAVKTLLAVNGVSYLGLVRATVAAVATSATGARVTADAGVARGGAAAARVKCTAAPAAVSDRGGEGR